MSLIHICFPMYCVRAERTHHAITWVNNSSIYTSFKAVVFKVGVATLVGSQGNCSGLAPQKIIQLRVQVCHNIQMFLRKINWKNILLSKCIYWFLFILIRDQKSYEFKVIYWCKNLNFPILRLWHYVCREVGLREILGIKMRSPDILVWKKVTTLCGKILSNNLVTYNYKHT